MRLEGLWRAAAFITAAFLGGMAGSWILNPETPEAGVVQLNRDSPIVGTYGVGGVITADGELWQYRPDKESWITLDESFALEGQGTNVVPLPIPVENIRFMETFGFLVARNGECWLYDLELKSWVSVGGPPQ
jgi:hypothetical protein